MRRLQIDRRGKVGELYVKFLLEEIGRECVHDFNTKDRENKQWDIRVPENNMCIEVKTATLTASNGSFQHEDIERSRNWNGLILLDVAPNKLYITCEAKSQIDWNKFHFRPATEDKYKYTLNIKNLDNNELNTIEDFRRHYEAMVAVA